MVIRVGLVGYGTIGKRVADAIMKQKDMKLVGITGHSYSYRIEVAKKKKIPIFSMDGPLSIPRKQLIDDNEQGLHRRTSLY